MSYGNMWKWNGTETKRLKKNRRLKLWEMMQYWSWCILRLKFSPQWSSKWVRTKYFFSPKNCKNKNFLRPEKSTLSLWKLVTFYPNKQIWPNKLIEPKLCNHDNMKFVWSRIIVGIVFKKLMSYKSVNKLHFGQNDKMWANLAFLNIWSVYFSNTEKY